METPIYEQSLGQRVKEIIISELRYYFQTTSQFGTPGSTVKMPVIREAYGVDLRNCKKKRHKCNFRIGKPVK